MNGDMIVNHSVERQKIVEDLKAGIANGTFKPGQRLVETHLSELFGVNRSRIREALRKLEQDGFAKIIPNVGAFVLEFSQKDIEHIYDLMSVLEGLAVRVITPYMTNEQLESMEVLIKKMETTEKTTQFYKYNNDLHTLLITWSENDYLIKLTENLRLRIRCIILQNLYGPGQIAASIREHRELLQVMKQRKAERAEKLMRNHIFHAKNRFLKYLNKSL
jgi:DNA-binding GntR family transcriptional regulator